MRERTKILELASIERYRRFLCSRVLGTVATVRVRPQGSIPSLERWHFSLVAPQLSASMLVATLEELHFLLLSFDFIFHFLPQVSY